MEFFLLFCHLCYCLPTGTRDGSRGFIYNKTQILTLNQSHDKNDEKHKKVLQKKTIFILVFPDYGPNEFSSFYIVRSLPVSPIKA